ncbi:MAG: hypothetical protein V3R96_03330 [Dehalococcoidales bacterium]
MASLQYVIDSICANFTEESMYRLIEVRVSQGPFTVGEILPLIQSKDRSLDPGSAKMLAETAFEVLAQRGDIRVEGDRIYPAHKK